MGKLTLNTMHASPARTRAPIRWALFAIVPFSGFYTVKLGLSPIYLTFTLAVLALLAGSLQRLRIGRNAPAVLASALLLTYITVLLAHGWTFDSPLPSAWVNLAFSLLYFIVTTIVLENSTRRHVIRASEMAVVLSIALLAFELTYRLTHPVDPEDLWTTDREDIFWYVYKTSSFMYPDSNSVGLFVSCLIAFVVGVPPTEARRLRKYLPPLLILVLGSLSRAAILATCAVFLYQYSSGSRTRTVLFSVLALAAGLATLAWFATDESFMSKLWIAGLVAIYASTTEWPLLLIGVGPGNAETALGVGAHLLPFTLLVEIGVLGTLLTAALWLFIWKRSGRHGTPLILALLVNGLSFTTFAIPWFYAMAAVLIHLSRVAPSARLSPNSGL